MKHQTRLDYYRYNIYILYIYIYRTYNILRYDFYFHVLVYRNESKILDAIIFKEVSSVLEKVDIAHIYSTHTLYSIAISNTMNTLPVNNYYVTDMLQVRIPDLLSKNRDYGHRDAEPLWRSSAAILLPHKGLL